MRSKFKNLLMGRYSNHVSLPLNLRTFPYWLKRSSTQVRRDLARRGGSKKGSSIWRYLHPDITDPIFIIGAPRSGTTFLGECLNVLDEVSYHFEPLLTKAAVKEIYEGNWGTRKSTWFYRFVYSWRMRFSKEPHLIFCEKTPGNCFILPFLLQSFPRARFVHIIRDGRDAALSLSRKPWYSNESINSGIRDHDGYLYGPDCRFYVEENRCDEFFSTTDLHRCIWIWRRYVEEAIAGSQIIPKTQLLKITYEELVNEPTRVSTELLDFLCIESKDSRAKFLEYVEENSQTDSVGKWINDLNESDHHKLLSEAGKLLKENGYKL